MKYYIIAGEASGDLHGSNLIKELKKLDTNASVRCWGGDKMEEAGGELVKHYRDLAFMGFTEVLMNLRTIFRNLAFCKEDIQRYKPDVLILIDYPGFNLRIAKWARQQGLKVIYYISPQVWAWNRGRIKGMARCLDLVLCIFPFEADLYNESGLRALFVGHPMIERLQVRKADVERDPNLIGLFPGSRLREVRKILPVSIETARLLLRSKPTLRFEVAAASEELAQEISKMLTPHLDCLSSVTSGAPRTRPIFEIMVGKTAEIMQRAWVGIVASGSATLEAAYFRMPFALVYKVAWPTYLAARLVVNVNYLGMPNLLAGREVVPEFIQHRAQPDAIANALRPLIDDEKARNQMISQFDVVIPKLGGSGASEKAARAIIEEIGIRSSAVITR